ncbi:MAG: MarR family transcriptional regulator [Chitinispirillaceae bacterium]|nr:MarR family transcriptional regulator [Chitinispirillaceae bacterium]
MKTLITDLIHVLKEKCVINDDMIRSKTPLSPSEYRAVLSLNPDDQISSASFSDRLGLSPSRGSRVIDKMVANGFIRRDTLSNNRRAQVISLAPEGLNLKKQINQLMFDCEEKIKVQMTDSEYANAEKSLKQLISIL